MIRALGYYLFHTFINQIRKMFRTWVLIFLLICGLMGGLVGYLGASLANENVSATEKEESITEDSFFENVLPDMEEEQIPKAGMALVSLIALFYAAFSADKRGSAIFLPADAALLFPSPLSPQSVLLWRLSAAMGNMIAMILTFTLLLPMMMDITGISLLCGISLLLAMLFLLFYVQLLQAVFYTFAGSNEKHRRILRAGSYACLMLLAVLFLVLTGANGNTPSTTAVRILTSTRGRWIPIWGWLRGFIVSFSDGNWPLALIFLCLLIIGCLCLFVLLGHMKADFYEEAQAKSEEAAARLEEIQSGKKTLHKKTGKVMPDRLRTSCIKRGSGADVFFWKSLGIRYRSASFHVFTKTSYTYLVTAVAAALLARRMLPEYADVVPVLALGIFVFFRSLSNPLEDDLKSSFFFLTPEPSTKKLLMSELGGLCTCVMDLLPGLIAGAILTEMHPEKLLGSCLFILTLYVYSMNVSAFLSTSLPANASLVVKQLVQIMFVYFGLLPDIALFAIAFSGKVPQITLLRAFLLASAVNLAVGCVFFFMIPAFLDPLPRRVTYAVEQPTEEEEKTARHTISYAGFTCFLVFAIDLLSQIIFSKVLDINELTDTEAWLVTFLPLYAVAFPLGLFLMMRKKPKRSPVPVEAMTAKRFFACFAAAYCLMYAGNMVGTLLNTALDTLIGRSSLNNAIALVQSGDSIWKVLFPVIAAPVFEELFFRKAIIDDLAPLGERFALIFSAVAFGLFHGNLVQTIYAFLLGLVFAYVYIRTRQIRWTMIMHVMINSLSTIVGSKIIGDGKHLGTGAIAYFVFIAALVLVGVIVVVTRGVNIYFLKEECELPRKTAMQLTWKSPGFLAFLALMAGVMAYSFIH